MGGFMLVGGVLFYGCWVGVWKNEAQGKERKMHGGKSERRTGSKLLTRENGKWRDNVTKTNSKVQGYPDFRRGLVPRGALAKGSVEGRTGIPDIRGVRGAEDQEKGGKKTGLLSSTLGM